MLFHNGEFRWDGYGLYAPASNRHLVMVVNDDTFDFGYTLPMTSTWTHLAVVRTNGYWMLFVNGTRFNAWRAWYYTPNTPMGHASIGADTFGGNSWNDRRRAGLQSGAVGSRDRMDRLG